MIKFLAVKREPIKKFLKDLLSALGHCFIEDPEVVGIVVLASVCVGIFLLAGVAVYNLIVDPHVTTAAALDSLSINPDKWIPR